MAKRKPLFSLFIFICFLSLFSSILADDAPIMVKLASSFSPAPSGWSGSDPCKWSGVNCDGSKRVTSIDISSKSVSGTLAPEINQLFQLKTLSLQRNQIYGSLPSFSNLTNLQELFLDTNNFTSVPASTFVGLTSLQTLSLSYNLNLDPWFLPLDLTQSSNLVTLSVSNANLMGSMPDFFGSFPSMQSLRLSYNNLTGPLPPSLAGSGIQNLWLNNQVLGLSGPIDIIGTMSQLSQVWLNKNAFSGPIPDLSNCTSLWDLQLRDNQLTGVLPTSIFSLQKLVNVSLANNKLQGPYPDFGGRVEATIGSTNSFCNPKPGPCDPQVMTLLAVAGALGYPMSLAESWEGNNACQQWSFINCDSQGTNVTGINFSKQHFTGTISPLISSLASLRNLYLNDNNLTGPIPDSLTSLSQLQILDVSNNNLTGKIPEFPPGVTVKKSGNLLLGTNSSSGDGGGGGNPGSGSDTNSPSGSQSGKQKPSNISAGLIAGIVIAVLVVIGVVFILLYKYYTKKRQQKFGRFPNDPQKGKEMVKNGIVGTMDGYGGVASELHSQSSGDNSDVHFFEGGKVAISIQVLRQVTDNFSQKNILGRGGFGVVYKGELHDGTQIAVKRMESTVMGTKGLGEFQAEIAVLTKVRHRHLVALLGFCINGNERLLVYEYMPQGTLGQHLFDWSENGTSPLSWKQRVSIALDVARGVEYLHSLAQQSFIHRDLKPSNILLGDDMRAKVSDFGLVKNAPDGKYSVETRLAGTFGYLAPEYAATGRVTTKVDVYAFGVVLMELITGRKALDETMPEERSHLVTWFRRVLINKENINKAIDATLDPDDETFGNICKVAELAGHCTAREPSQRPDMGHAVNILGPLVEQWKPTSNVDEDGFALDLRLSLPEALERWQANEGTSTMVDDLNYGPMSSLGNTQSSIPTKPSGFGDTFYSGR